MNRSAALPPATVSFQPTGTSKPKSGAAIIIKPSGAAAAGADVAVGCGTAVGAAPPDCGTAVGAGDAPPVCGAGALVAVGAGPEVAVGTAVADEPQASISSSNSSDNAPNGIQPRNSGLFLAALIETSMLFPGKAIPEPANPNGANLK